MSDCLLPLLLTHLGNLPFPPLQFQVYRFNGCGFQKEDASIRILLNCSSGCHIESVWQASNMPKTGSSAPAGVAGCNHQMEVGVLFHSETRKQHLALRWSAKQWEGELFDGK